MAKRREDEEEQGLAGVLFGGGKPQLKDLTDPKKRKQALKVAKMMGFEIRKEQMVRIGIGVAIAMVILLIGLWAIAKVLGLLFWAALALIACSIIVRFVSPKRPKTDNVQAAKTTHELRPASPATVEKGNRELEAWNREAEERADRALEDLERKLKG